MKKYCSSAINNISIKLRSARFKLLIQILDSKFSMVFSNSVIEHAGAELNTEKQILAHSQEAC